jgi:hypothetical protein
MSVTPTRPRFTNQNLVWDLNTLLWVAMQQPMLNAGTVTANLTGTGLLTETTYLTRHTYALDYVGGSNPIYIGLAVPGSAQSAAAWQIRKLTFDVNNNVTDIKYAGGTNAYTSIWDNRAALSYS